MRPLLKRLGPALFLILVSAQAFAGQGPAAEAGWTSADPLSIPHAERLRWLQAGNLAPNPSFEEGEPGGGGFAACGWTRVGERVDLVVRGRPPVSPPEVSDGERAVRVRRPSAGESDPAEGILSDFIPVIPGNFEFTYDVRLENLTSPRPRFGARLDDAVTVRLQFFDRDRTPLDGRSLNPVGRTPIDAGDKSYPFANYWSIDAFPWATVRARTYNYPYSEGDIPDGARFVRLFIGLRSAGTLWVDRVVFRYSKWNFTALERLQPWFARDLEPLERLIPAPKTVRPLRPVAWRIPAGGAQPPPPLVVLPDAPEPAERTAAELLVDALNRGARADARAAIADAGLPLGTILDRTLVFAIGRNRLVEELKPELPLAELHGREQGYLVVPVEAGTCQVVFLAAESALGAYYAAATAAQLVDGATGVYHSAAVVDYPDFLVRSYRLATWSSLAELDRDLQGLERMSRHKLNRAYAGYSGRNPDWYRPERLYRVGVEEAGEWCRRTRGHGARGHGQPVRAFRLHAGRGRAERGGPRHLDPHRRGELGEAAVRVPDRARRRGPHGHAARGRLRPARGAQPLELLSLHARGPAALREPPERAGGGAQPPQGLARPRLPRHPHRVLPALVRQRVHRPQRGQGRDLLPRAGRADPARGRDRLDRPHGPIAFARRGRPAPLPGPRPAARPSSGTTPSTRATSSRPSTAATRPTTRARCACATSSSRSTPNGRRPSTNSPTDAASM